MSTLELIAELKKLDPEGIIEVYRADYVWGEMPVERPEKMARPPDGLPSAVLLN